MSTVAAMTHDALLAAGARHGTQPLPFFDPPPSLSPLLDGSEGPARTIRLPAWEAQHLVDLTSRLDPGDPTVAAYADAMRRGDWRDGSEMTFLRYRGKLQLRNGQHRLTAQARAAAAVTYAVVVVDGPGPNRRRPLQWPHGV